MHQQPRIPQKSASPASSPRPGFTSPVSPPSRPRSTVPNIMESEKRPRSNSGAAETAATASDAVQRLNLILQNFFVKSAALIIHSRLKIQKFTQQADGPRYNRWFQLQTRDFDDFREELREWKNCTIDNLPRSLVIETYLDTSRLSKNQTLVAIDEHGKRWSVIDSLRSTAAETKTPISSRPEVVLERWTVNLNAEGWKESGNVDFSTLNSILPAVYKRCIVFFRALYTLSNLGPVYEHCQRYQEKNHLLTPRIRVVPLNKPVNPQKDTLYWSLCGQSNVVTKRIIGEVDLPIGAVSIQWVHRNECDFRIDDNDDVFGSHLIGMDDRFFKPSVPKPIAIRRGIEQPVPSSLPGTPPTADRPGTTAPVQTYGSLNTFHGENAISTSPMTALNQVKAPGSEESSYSQSRSNTPAVDSEIPHSLPAYGGRTTVPSRLNLREAHSRRQSSSSPFSPFKAGSLSASPRPPDADVPSSPQTSRITSYLAHARNKSHSATTAPSQLRNAAPSVPSSVESHLTNSPKPSSVNKYSSSFPHRRNTLSTNVPPRLVQDEHGGSGRQSLISDVVPPGSGLYPESISNSFQTDEGDLSDFLKILDSKKSLRSFESNAKGESTTSRTIAQISKFMSMRESNNALSESISASVTLSKPPVRRISGTSPAGWSSSSPDKPQSPHAPAVPSRLSENLLAEPEKPSTQMRIRRDEGAGTPASAPLSHGSSADCSQAGAIDIPLSPRGNTFMHRPSLVIGPSISASGEGEDEEEEEDLPFGDDSLSQNGGVSLRTSEANNAPIGPLRPPAEMQGIRPTSTAPIVTARAPTPSSQPNRRRYMGMAGLSGGNATANDNGRGQTPSSGRGSLLGSGSGRISRGGENEMFPFEFAESPNSRFGGLQDGEIHRSGSAGVENASRSVPKSAESTRVPERFRSDFSRRGSTPHGW
ncbi:Autophagy-related protein 13 [Ceratocystis lukuohia]|uniref:Autophagy-related protein 13 n=1 Tax=Ceratocystis lukuohia TaxID=2019550 RepID=A0ABR4MI73_9PEZI